MLVNSNAEKSPLYATVTNSQKEFQSALHNIFLTKKIPIDPRKMKSHGCILTYVKMPSVHGLASSNEVLASCPSKF